MRHLSESDQALHKLFSCSKEHVFKLHLKIAGILPSYIKTRCAPSIGEQQKLSYNLVIVSRNKYINFNSYAIGKYIYIRHIKKYFKERFLLQREENISLGM